MIQIEPIKQFSGFGKGQRPDEYFYSQNMAKTQRGIAPAWAVTRNTVAEEFAWFAEKSSILYYAISTTGKIYSASEPDGSWTLQDTPGQTGTGKGLIVDQKGRLLYCQNRYLGMYDGDVTWTDTWKDFGAASTNYHSPTLYEDWVAFCNDNKIALLNTTDDSFNAAGLTLPTSFETRAVSGNRGGILVGANVNGKGWLILWQPEYLRSITPWIPLESEVESIQPYKDGWVVVTKLGIFLTNGYSIEPLDIQPLDSAISNDQNFTSILDNVRPQGVSVIGDTLMILGTHVFGNSTKISTGRMIGGAYLFNLQTGLYEFIKLERNCQGFSGKAILLTNIQTPLIAFKSSTTNYVGAIGQNAMNSGRNYELWLEVGRSSDNEKVAEAIKLNFEWLIQRINESDADITVKAKIYNFKRPLWGTTLINDTSTTTSLKVAHGSALYAQVGDEILSYGTIGADEYSKITAITPGVTSDTWTISPALSGVPQNAEQIQYLPMQEISSKTFSTTDEIKDMYLNIKNRIRGRRFLIKLIITSGAQSTTIPELIGGYFVYDDLGIINTR